MDVRWHRMPVPPNIDEEVDAMTRPSDGSTERSRSRGAEGSIVLVMVVGGLIAALTFVGSQVAHLFGGLGRALP